MKIQPDQVAFEAGTSGSKGQLVWTEIVADLETPITTSLKLKEKGRPFFLLESVEGGSNRGRYSIIGVDPDLTWKCDTRTAYIKKGNGPFEAQEKEVLSSLRETLAASRLDIPEHLPPMASGMIGYMSYDAIRFVETTIPDENQDALNIPTGLFFRPR
ncbi:MAG: anthranilate synthase component 1, partial [Candidatus Marinamargulisbacteria bacterium]